MTLPTRKEAMEIVKKLQKSCFVNNPPIIRIILAYANGDLVKYSEMKEAYNEGYTDGVRENDLTL